MERDGEKKREKGMGERKRERTYETKQSRDHDGGGVESLVGKEARWVSFGCSSDHDGGDAWERRVEKRSRVRFDYELVVARVPLSFLSPPQLEENDPSSKQCTHQSSP